MIAQLQQSGDSVVGNMLFDNFEKDGSSGMVHGRFHGDTIRLWYRFTSEGMNSVMQLLFKKQGDTIIRGIGAMDAIGDTAYFKDPDNVDFPLDQSFGKVNCDDVKNLRDSL
jgi:hypothetical protein